MLLVIPAAIYGGYFGAGVSVIVLAVLGLVLDDSLTRLNALKQAIAFSINIAAAIFFLFSGQIVWSAVAVMAVGALIGGALGGRVAGRIRQVVLRRVIVASVCCISDILCALKLCTKRNKELLLYVSISVVSIYCDRP